MVDLDKRGHWNKLNENVNILFYACVCTFVAESLKLCWIPRVIVHWRMRSLISVLFLFCSVHMSLGGDGSFCYIKISRYFSFYLGMSVSCWNVVLHLVIWKYRSLFSKTFVFFVHEQTDTWDFSNLGYFSVSTWCGTIKVLLRDH